VRADWRAAGYTTVGLDLVLSIGLGTYAGYWLDGYFDVRPVLTVLGVVFGCAAGFRFVWRAAQRMRHEGGGDSFESALTDRQLMRRKKRRKRERASASEAASEVAREVDRGE
jgi:hypothetical protein